MTKPTGTVESTAAIPSTGAARAAVRGARLEVTRGPDAGLAYVSKSDRVVVGSDPGADLVLTDRTVSRFHCELELSEGRVRLRDLGSKNGTSIEGVGVLEGFVADGAAIQLGGSELRFERRAQEVDVPLSERERFGLLVGRSAAMRRVFALLEQVASSEATVLIHGETGTGKEAAAESLHLESGRREKPFVVIDCGALPTELMEAELFGHERGAFTGAANARAGLFEEADGGTVFLDEVGELPIALQTKLLRVLERRQLRRVGGNTYRSVDVRIVAATNRDLKTEVNDKRFRADLYFRLAVVEVRLPPLRERLEDLPTLLDHLLDAQAPSTRASALDRGELLRELARHRWPGNVRELRNYVERCVALQRPVTIEHDADRVSPSSLPELGLPLKESREAWNRTLERVYIEAVLARSERNVARAARLAGVDRMYFYRLLWRHGLR